MRSYNRYSVVFQIIGNGRNYLFPKGKFQTSRNETMDIADHKYVTVSKFVLLDIKLLLKEDSISHTLNE